MRVIRSGGRRSALVALIPSENGCTDACVGVRGDQEHFPTGTGQVLSSDSLWDNVSYRTSPGSASSVEKQQASIDVSEMDLS